MFYEIEKKLFSLWDFPLIVEKGHYSAQSKNVRQGKLIAVVYILRTYLNQFALGGICKQE